MSDRQSRRQNARYVLLEMGYLSTYVSRALILYEKSDDYLNNESGYYNVKILSDLILALHRKDYQQRRRQSTPDIADKDKNGSRAQKSKHKHKPTQKHRKGYTRVLRKCTSYPIRSINDHDNNKNTNNNPIDALDDDSDRRDSDSDSAIDSDNSSDNNSDSVGVRYINKRQQSMHFRDKGNNKNNDYQQTYTLRSVHNIRSHDEDNNNYTRNGHGNRNRNRNINNSNDDEVSIDIHVNVVHNHSHSAKEEVQTPDMHSNRTRTRTRTRSGARNHSDNAEEESHALELRTERGQTVTVDAAPGVVTPGGYDNATESESAIANDDDDANATQNTETQPGAEPTPTPKSKRKRKPRPKPVAVRTTFGCHCACFDYYGKRQFCRGTLIAIVVIAALVMAAMLCVMGQESITKAEQFTIEGECECIDHWTTTSSDSESTTVTHKYMWTVVQIQQPQQPQQDICTSSDTGTDTAAVSETTNVNNINNKNTNNNKFVSSHKSKKFKVGEIRVCYTNTKCTHVFIGKPSSDSNEFNAQADQQYTIAIILFVLAPFVGCFGFCWCQGLFDGCCGCAMLGCD